MARFEVGETIRFFLKEDRLWYDGYIESINHENKLYRVKDDGDEEDITISDVRKHWGETEPVNEKSSINKRQRTKKMYT